MSVERARQARVDAAAARRRELTTELEWSAVESKKINYVRTAEGARKYGEPIGSPIRPNGPKIDYTRRAPKRTAAPTAPVRPAPAPTPAPTEDRTVTAVTGETNVMKLPVNRLADNLLDFQTQGLKAKKTRTKAEEDRLAELLVERSRRDTLASGGAAGAAAAADQDAAKKITRNAATSVSLSEPFARMSDVGLKRQLAEIMAKPKRSGKENDRAIAVRNEMARRKQVQRSFGTKVIAWDFELEEKTRYVRTADGMRKYGEPIGSPIVTSRDALRPTRLASGRPSLGVSTKKKTTSGLTSGDEVLTRSSGVGRSVSPSTSGGELRRVSSIEDAEGQHGPAGKGKNVVRFEDGSFTGPVDRDSEWGVADRPNTFSKNDEDGPRLLTVEGAKRKKEQDAAAMAERMKGVEIRRSGNNTKLVVNGEVVGEWIDPKQIVANNYKDNPEAVAKQVEVHRKKKLIEEYVRADTDLSFADWSAGR